MNERSKHATFRPRRRLECALSAALAAILCAVLSLAPPPLAPGLAAGAAAPGAGQGTERGLVQRHFALARALEEAGHHDEAREHYLRVLEREERHLATLHALARLEGRAGDVDAAVDYAGRFLDVWRHLRVPPRALNEARRELAELVARSDPLRRRLDALRRGHVARLLRLAGQQMDRGAWHSARAILVEALATDPEHPELSDGLVRIRREGGNELAVEDETGGADPLAGVTPEWIEENDKKRESWENAWTEDTPHYRIRTNAGYRMLRTVAGAMEQMHAFYRIFHQYKTDGGAVPVAAVHIYRDREEYRTLGGSPVEWAAGHWDGSRVVTYDQRGGGDGSLRGTLQVLFHEASHQFTSLAGGSSVPSWLNEGMASFFEGTRLLSNGKVEWNLVAPGRLYPLVEELRRADRNRIENVIRGEVDDYRVYYPWGWGIVYHLYNAEDDTGRLLYRPLMKEYFQEYHTPKHVERFSDFFVRRARVPGVSSLEDFERRFIEAMFRLEDEDRGRVDAARTYEQRGDLQVALADWERAAELYERSLRRDPEHPELLWKLAFALERAGARDRAAGTLRQWLSVAELDDDRTELGTARRAEALARIGRLDPVARRLDAARAEFHADSVTLAREYRERGFPRTALRVLRGPATAVPPSSAARALYFDIQDATGIGLESWRLLFNEEDLTGFYGDGQENFRVADGVLLARVTGEVVRGRAPRGEADAPLTGRPREEGTLFLFRRLFIDRQPSGDWSLAAEIGLGQDCRMAGLCFGKKESGSFHGVVLLPEGYVDLSAFELDGRPLVRTAAPLRPGWNHLRIDVAGTRIVASVNGELAIDHEFESRAELQGDFGLLAGAGASSFREVKMLEYDQGLPRRTRIGRRPAGARITDAGAYAPPERAKAGSPSFLGSAPPLLRGLTWFGDVPEEGDLDRLLGWPAILVFTKSTVEPTHPVLPALAALEARHGELGIPVLLVSNEQAETVAAFAKQKELRHPIASGWEQEAYEDYALAKHGIPRALLFDLDGSVVWEGNPDYDPEHGSYLDEPLDELVKRRKLREIRAAGPQLEAAEAAFQDGRHVEAATLWTGVATLGVAHPVVVTARAGLGRLEERAAERLERAGELAATGRLLEAMAVLTNTAARFEGVPGAAEAARRAEALRARREWRDAQRVGNRIMRAEKQLARGKLELLREELEKLLAQAAPGDDPWVEERARWLLAAIEAGVSPETIVADYLAAWPELHPPQP